MQALCWFYLSGSCLRFNISITLVSACTELHEYDIDHYVVQSQFADWNLHFDFGHLPPPATCVNTETSLNGRQIKNTVRLALALALASNKRQQLEMSHLLRTRAITSDFISELIKDNEDFPELNVSHDRE